MKKLFMLALVAMSLSACGFRTVDSGNLGIQTRFGEIVGEPLQPGLHFYNPFTSSVQKFSVRQDTWNSSTAVFTSDNQAVKIAFAVTYSPEEKAVNSIYKTIGLREALEENIIKPNVTGAIQTALGKTMADELNQKKDLVAKETFNLLREKLAAKNVILHDLNFVDTDFEDSYEKAAEAKVVAIQEAQRAKNETVKIEEEARQKVLSAKADAEAMRIKTQALSQNKALVQYELVQRWDGKLPSFMMGGGSMPLLNVNELMKNSNTDK